METINPDKNGEKKVRLIPFEKNRNRTARLESGADAGRLWAEKAGGACIDTGSGGKVKEELTVYPSRTAA